MLSRVGGLNRRALTIWDRVLANFDSPRPPQVTIPTTPRISATAAIQLAPRSTGARWRCGEQVLSRAGGLNRAASTDWDIGTTKKLIFVIRDGRMVSLQSFAVLLVGGTNTGLSVIVCRY